MTNVSLLLVIDAIAKASVILAVAALAAAALRRASASARHFVWTLGLLSALAAPALSLAVPRWELPLVTVPSSSEIDRAVQPPSLWHRPAPPPKTGQPPLFANEGDTLTSATSRAPALPSWPVVALSIWAIGASLILARLLIGLVAVQWMSRRTPEVASAPWLAEARSLAAELGLARVRFLRGAVGTMPMAWGIVRQSVLVPADADTWPAHRVRVVLLHELAHVKRRDCLTHLVAQLACAAYWFNPLVWMAARRLRAERERACDDLVLASGTRGSDYADQLLDIARVMQGGRFPAVFAGASLAMAQRSQLEGRLIAILDPSVPRRGLSRARAAAAAATFTAVMVAIASVQPWAEARGAAIQGSVADAAAGSTPAAPAQSSEPATHPRAPERATGNRLDGVRGGISGGVESGISGSVAGGIGGIAAGVSESVTRGVIGGIVSAVGDSVASGSADALAEVVPQARQDDGQDQDSAKVGGRDPRAVNALLEALKDSDKGVRETAMHALVQLRDPRMFDPLVTALKDASAEIREQAAFGLGQLRDARAISPLATALKDSNASVREQVAFALGQIRDNKAIEPLISSLKDENASVREQAAFALGQIRDPRAIDGLLAALKDTNASVRQQAAFALGQIR